MHFSEILNQLTGISTPVFGVSWNPPQAERIVARRVVSFLEDRRVLYLPSEMENPRHCVESVLEIRHYLTSELGSLPSETEIAQSLRSMRAACRKFLNRVSADKDGAILTYGSHRNHWASWIFNDALGQMRGVFGIHIAQIAAKYGLDVEDDLATLIPDQDKD